MWLMDRWETLICQSHDQQQQHNMLVYFWPIMLFLSHMMKCEGLVPVWGLHHSSCCVSQLCSPAHKDSTDSVLSVCRRIYNQQDFSQEKDSCCFSVSVKYVSISVLVYWNMCHMLFLLKYCFVWVWWCSHFIYVHVYIYIICVICYFLF